MLAVGGHKVRTAGMRMRKARRKANRKAAVLALVARKASKG
jgi:hypothetical protein